MKAPITWGRYKPGISRLEKRSGPTSSSHRTGGPSWRPEAGSSSLVARMTGTFARSMPRLGEMLWQHRTNSGIIGVPVSYALDGVQYVAVQSGWGVDAASMQQAVNQSGRVTQVPQGGVVLVFALR